MYRTLLKSKMHRVAVTGCELHCEGSRAIGEDLPHAADQARNGQVRMTVQPTGPFGYPS